MGYPEIYEHDDTEQVGYSNHPQNGGYINREWEGLGGWIVKEADDLFVAYYMGEEIGSANTFDLAKMLIENEAGW